MGTYKLVNHELSMIIALPNQHLFMKISCYIQHQIMTKSCLYHDNLIALISIGIPNGYTGKVRIGKYSIENISKIYL